MTSSKRIDIGDLVWMPRHADDQTIDMIGVVVEKAKPGTWDANHRRIGVFWADGSGIVDFEPIEWLEKV